MLANISQSLHYLQLAPAGVGRIAGLLAAPFFPLCV